MASYSRPTAADIMAATGLNRYLSAYDEEEFGEWLATLVQDGEDEAALEVGESAFDAATWTERQARTLARAVCYYTAAVALTHPELQKVTGTHEPLLMEDAAEIAEVQDRLRARGESLLNLVESGASTGTDDEPFALPSISSSTFDVTGDERTPSEKLALQDERDDRPAWDTDEELSG